MSEQKSAADLLFEKGPMADLARKGAEELGDPLSPHNLKKRMGGHEKPWSARIPAAIERAEEHLATHSNWDAKLGCQHGLNLGEVALAKLAYDWECGEFTDPGDHWTPPPALRSFTEEVEKLT